MFTREEALKRSREELGKDWDARRGTFDVAIELEDEHDFVVIPGAREWLVEQKQEYASYDDTFYWFDKQNGLLRLGSQMDEGDIAKIERCTTVDGVEPPSDES